MLHVVNFTGLLQLVNKLKQACQFHPVATSLLRSGLLQLVICRLVTTCWNNLQQTCWSNQPGTRLLTTCNRLVTSWCKPCKRILICRLVVKSCYKLSTGFLQLLRFWLHMKCIVLWGHVHSHIATDNIESNHCYLLYPHTHRRWRWAFKITCIRFYFDLKLTISNTASTFCIFCGPCIFDQTFWIEQSIVSLVKVLKMKLTM